MLPRSATPSRETEPDDVARPLATEGVSGDRPRATGREIVKAPGGTGREGREARGRARRAERGEGSACSLDVPLPAHILRADARGAVAERTTVPTERGASQNSECSRRRRRGRRRRGRRRQAGPAGGTRPIASGRLPADSRLPSSGDVEHSAVVGRLVKFAGRASGEAALA